MLSSWGQRYKTSKRKEQLLYCKRVKISTIDKLERSFCGLWSLREGKDTALMLWNEPYLELGEVQAACKQSFTPHRASKLAVSCVQIHTKCHVFPN